MKLPVDFGTMTASLVIVALLVVLCWVGGYVAWIVSEL